MVTVDSSGHPIHAFSDDYAMLIQGLLDLYQVTADLEYLKLAERLQNDMVCLCTSAIKCYCKFQASQFQDRLFWDKAKESGYFIANEHGDVKVRVMEGGDPAGIFHGQSSPAQLVLFTDQDGAEPCANSIAVGNLIRLYDYLETSEFKRKAEKILQACSTRLTK